MSDESVTDEQAARTEFERAMRGCRRNIQRRLDRQTSVHSIPDEPGGIDRETKPMWSSKR